MLSPEFSRLQPVGQTPFQKGDILVHREWPKASWDEWCFEVTGVQGNILVVKRRLHTHQERYNEFSFRDGWAFLNRKEKTGFAKFIRKIEETVETVEMKKRPRKKKSNQVDERIGSGQ